MLPPPSLSISIYLSIYHLSVFILYIIFTEFEYKATSIYLIYVIYIFEALYSNSIKTCWAMYPCSHYIFSQYTPTPKKLYSSHWVSAGLNEKHTPDVRARKAVTGYGTSSVIHKEGVFRSVIRSCYQLSREEIGVKTSEKQGFALVTREKKQSNESRHTGSHPRNDPVVQIESTQSWRGLSSPVLF